MRPDVLKGHLDVLLLSVLAGEPAHGYAIIERLRARSNGVFDLPEGTIYPALHRLERARLLSSDWDDRSGRRRRVYRVTAAGRATMRQEARDWALFRGAVTAILEGA
jgi:DNA-binding PadR family transcriptional regulator